MQMESESIGEGRKGTWVLWPLAVISLALLLRLLSLGSEFLRPDEAALAAASLGVARGQGITSAVPWPDDALFFGLNTVLFFIGAVSNFWARFWPAFFGSALVAMPFLLPTQSERERWRNLIFASLLAVSPSFVFWSRHLDGSVGAAFGAFMFLVFLLRRRKYSTYASGAALALLFLSGRAGMVYLVSIGVVGVWLLSQKEYRWLGKQLLSDLPSMAISFAVVYALVSTVGFSFLPGLGIGAGGIARWFTDFVRPGQIPWWWIGLHLLLDEPLILLLALLAFLDKDLWNSPRPSLLFSWAFVALMLVLWQIGRSPGDILAVLLPLAWVGAEALSRLAFSDEFRTIAGDWNFSISIVVTELVLFFYLGITLAMYTQRGEPMLLLLSLAGAMIFVSVAVFSYTYVGVRGALQMVLVSTAIILLLYGLHLAIGLGIEGDPLRAEAYIPQAVSADFQSFMDQVRAESFHKVGDDRLVSIDVVGVDPRVRWVLVWSLRDFDNVRFLDAVPRSQAELVVTPDSPSWLKKVHDYSGMEISVLEDWSPAGVWGSQLLRWIQLRERGEPDAVHKVILWVSPK
jgi:hypothetical protein